MLHHVAVEVRADDVERSVEFWEIAGFARVPVPEPVRDAAVWLEREGTQIHLLLADEPTAPRSGHPAAVVADFEATLARLREAGFEVQRSRELWGEPRAKARAPGGHVVELMAAPPPPATG